MKSIKDFKGEEAIDLWATLLEPIASILADESVRKVVQSKQPVVKIVSHILSTHKAEILEIVKAVDDTEVTAVNLPIRAIAIFNDIAQTKEYQEDFFAVLGLQTD